MLAKWRVRVIEGWLDKARVLVVSRAAAMALKTDCMFRQHARNSTRAISGSNTNTQERDMIGDWIVDCCKVEEVNLLKLNHLDS